MIIDYEIRGDYTVGVVTVRGDLTATSVDKFRNKVAVLIAPNKNIRHFVIDFAQVNFMDSAGLGSLISIVKRIRDMKGDVKLARLNEAPKKLLNIVHAYKHFEIFDSLEEAIDSYHV
ncbi:STAS domain-containing protein [Pontiellaceae bacterium B12219]|nr:STAS domain-containing protein [Pontiellaceae bacterium B12219]